MSLESKRITFSYLVDRIRSLIHQGWDRENPQEWKRIVATLENVPDPWMALIVARNIPAANIARLQTTIERSGTSQCMLNLAKVRVHNLDSLENALLETGDPKWIWRWFNQIPEANGARVQQAVIKAGDPYWATMLFAYNSHQPWLDEDALRAVAAKDPKWLKHFDQARGPA